MQDINPRETRAPSPSLAPVLHIRRRKEDFSLLLTGLCYTPFHCLLSHIPVSQVLKNHTRNRGQAAFSLNAPVPPAAQHTAGYWVFGGLPGPVPSSAPTKAEVAVCLLPPTS